MPATMPGTPATLSRKTKRTSHLRSFMAYFMCADGACGSLAPERTSLSCL